MNEDLRAFKIRIIKYTVVIALIFAACSIPALGFSIPFLFGLSVGASVSAASFLLMIIMSKKVVESGEKWMASVGYIVRLPLYAVTFFAALGLGGMTAAIACLIGFMTSMVAVVYVHGIKAKFSKDRTVRPEVMEEFERLDREEEIWKN